MAPLLGLPDSKPTLALRGREREPSTSSALGLPRSDPRGTRTNTTGSSYASSSSVRSWEQYREIFTPEDKLVPARAGRPYAQPVTLPALSRGKLCSSRAVPAYWSAKRAIIDEPWQDERRLTACRPFYGNPTISSGTKSFRSRTPATRKRPRFRGLFHLKVLIEPTPTPPRCRRPRRSAAG